MIRPIMAIAATVALAAPFSAPALASDDSDELEWRGSCSNGSEWKLKAETEDDGTKVEFEVDSGVAGQSWDYVLSSAGIDISSGTVMTESDGEFEVEVSNADVALDTLSAFASSGAETCDSSVGVLGDDDDDEDDADDDGEDRDDDADEVDGDDDGACSADTVIALAVKKSGKKRVAILSIDGTSKGEKWQYKIRRGDSVVKKGSAKTSGKRATFTVKAKTKAKGVLTADARATDDSEACTTDDLYDY